MRQDNAFNSMMICLLSIMFSNLYLCNGFSPEFWVSLAASSTDSIDHQEITEAAALIVLKDYMLDNPNTVVDSTSVINRLKDPSPARDMFQAFYHGKTSDLGLPGLDLASFRYSDVIKTMKEANSEVDNSESALPEAHFDNEEIPEGNNRLLVIRQNIINHIQEGSYEKARTETGRALHTLQDFYSHSNWVELGNTEPLEDLGRPGRTLTNLAGEKLKTCTSCEQGVEMGTIFNFVEGVPIEVEREYNCSDNINEPVNSNRVLTTGYYSHLPTYKKPEGKCSHGGPGDLTSAAFGSKGGINKDLKSNYWSPHYYLHDQAAAVAEKACVLFLQDVRAAVGDLRFGAFMNIDIKQARFSMAFVIDTAASMSEELAQIQASLPRFQHHLEDYRVSLEGGVMGYVLVPFHHKDPGIVKITQSVSALTEYVQDLVTTGDGDCAKPSTEAMIRAAVSSERRGVINLYTDAPANDEQLRPELVSIINEKDLTVNIFLTAGCSRKRSTSRHEQQGLEDADTYQFLTAISGGQYLEVNSSDLSAVGSVLASSFKFNTFTILQQTGPAGAHTVEFQVDSTMTEFMITVNGNNVESVTLLTPQGHTAMGLPDFRVPLSSDSTYLAAMNISDSSFYGTWQLSFLTSSSYRVYIIGESSLMFEYRLYRRDTSSTLGFRNVKEKVLQGEELFLSVHTNQEVEQATVMRVTTLSYDGSVLTSTSSSAVGNGYFYAPIGTPASFFQIKIAGVDSRGYQFTRISRTGVDMTDVQITLGPGQFNLPFLVLRPGENKTVSLVLNNFGPTSTFSVKATSRSGSTRFKYYFPESGMAAIQTLNMEEGEKKGLALVIMAHRDLKTTEATSLALTVTMLDSNLVERSNFINIEVTGTTVPPVNRAEITFIEPEELGESWSNVILLIMSCSFLGLFTFLNFFRNN